MGSRWDELLYAGAAPHYRAGRMPYPPQVAEALRAELALDGTGRLLDVGCGPGALTVLLAPLFAEAVGVDPDAEMLAEAARLGIPNARWVQLAAEELPAGLGRFRVAVFAQSFHWLDRPRVRDAVAPMLEPGGTWVHVHATTDRGSEGDVPWDAIEDLIRAWLGPVRRAGSGLRDTIAMDEEEVVSARLGEPLRLEVGGGNVVERSADEIVAAVFSLSYAAPHLFGDRCGEFEAELRDLLGTKRFHERRVPVALSLWRIP